MAQGIPGQYTTIVAFSDVNHLGKDLTLNIHNEMTRLTLDIVTECVFGIGLIKSENFREFIYQNVITTS
ncbi:unnamed protein product [Rotaria sp. Silwood1]|nr:unnamed protein product [Rotaria sp. Silwood1]